MFAHWRVFTFQRIREWSLITRILSRDWKHNWSFNWLFQCYDIPVHTIFSLRLDHMTLAFNGTFQDFRGNLVGNLYNERKWLFIVSHVTVSHFRAILCTYACALEWIHTLDEIFLGSSLGQKASIEKSWFDFLIEPTCACCTVGSYASLSVRLSVCLSVTG